MRIFQGVTERMAGLGGFKYRKVSTVLIGLLLLAAAWRLYGWRGLVAVVSGLAFWAMLNVTRVLLVLKRAARSPVGYVGSAVMLHAKLKPGLALLDVMALTGSLGEALSAKDDQPQILRWTDDGESHVSCEFREGRLASWQLLRPELMPPTDASADVSHGDDSTVSIGS